jgi:predicted component of type VI protein secretion system
MAPDSFQLVQRSGPAPGKSYSLTKNEIYLGRDITNDIVINDPEISRKHARLTLQSEGYLLEDLGSTNGTFVDGKRITGPHILGAGEVIMLGDNVSLVYEAISDYDPEATVAVAPDEVPMTAPQAPMTTEPLPDFGPPATGQMPAQPPPSEVPPPAWPSPVKQQAEGTSNTRTWILAGCGCFVLVLCLIAAGVFAFDYLNLYCTPPFDVFLCP